MSPESLTTLLDLDTTGPTSSSATEVFGRSDVAGPGGSPAVVPPSDYALDLDHWGRRRGAELVKESDDLRGLAAKLGAATADADYWGRCVADFHGAAYEPAPDLSPVCTDPLRAEFVKQLTETPEFAAIRASTVLDPVAAEVATGAFAASFAKRLAEHEKEKQKGPPPSGKRKSSNSPGADAEIRTMQAAASACAAASKAVGEHQETCEMAGLGPGTDGRPLDPKRLAALTRKVRNSAKLKRIAELAGRFRRVAQSRQRQKVSHGQDEVIGVTVGDDLAKLVPAELALLADDDLWVDAARRLLERQAVVRETRATEPVGRGPIVVVVDESGSMNGAPVETAKALALALAWVARKQKRWCCLVGFSGGHEITPESMVVLPPGKTNEVALVAWLEHFFGGGTTADVPLSELPRKWPELVKLGMTRGKTDMVVITDAQVSVPPAVVASFLAFKAAEKVRVTTILIGADQAGDLGRVVDELHRVPALTPDAEVVGAVLGV